MGEWSEGRALQDRRLVAFLERSDFHGALALADSVIETGERSSRILTQRARALGGLGRNAEAVADFEEAVLGDYESCESHLEFAIYLMRAGKTGRAHTEFMEAKTFCDERHLPVIYRNLAVAGIKLDRLADAGRYVADGLAVAPGDSYLLGLKGMLVARENPLEAESLFARALGAGEVSDEILVPYALLLLNGGNAPKAVSVLEKAASAAPDSREIREYLAEALDRSGRPREAEPILRGLLAERDEPEARSALARALFHAGELAAALEIYRGLDETPETMDRIAMCLHGLGRLDEALPWARRAIAARPDWPQGMINLAVILAARGEIEEAVGLLERAVSLDPSNEAAASNLERLRAARR